MANVRCPMCSKVNAPDAAVCSFCGARLKPVGPGESASQAPASRPDDDEPEWMRGLRGDEPSAPASGPETPGGTGAEANQDADLPDWLARIRGRAQTESSGSEFGVPEETFDGQEEAQDNAQAGSLPDWLGQQGGGEAQESAAQSSSDDDWLTRLQSADSSGIDSSQTPDFSSTEDFSSGSEQDAGLSWLQQPPSEDDQAAATTPFDMGGWSEKPAEAEQPAADDWMSTFSSWTPEAAQESETSPAEPAGPADELSGLGLTGFFSNLEGGEEKPSEPPPAVETGSSGFGLTGFLSSLEGGEEPQPASPQEEVPSSGFGLTGFLSSLEAGSDQPSADDAGWDTPASSTPAAGSEEVLPDWLSGGEPAQAASEPAAPSGSTGELSSWLASLEGEQPQEPAARAPEQPTEDLPGWLASAGQESAPAVPQESQPEQSVPGWLSETPLEPPATPSETAHLGEDVPEWLADVQQPEAAAAPLPDWLAAQASADPEVTAEEFGARESTALESVAPRADAQEPPSIAEPASTGPTPFIDEDAPAWLRDFAAEGTAETEGAGILPLLEADEHPQMQAESEQPFAVDLPDWLEEDAARASTTEAATEATPSDDLARAELPSWVAAMRPVESSVMPGDTAAQDTDQYVEKAGPLSGMRGVLPIAENLIRYRKPPIYSVKLHTTEKQRNQAALLDSIVAQESQPLLIPPARSHAPHLIMRIVIALILVAVIALPNLMQMFGMPFDPLSKPALQPAELDEMYNQINQGAQPGEEYTVLLAFDYEPGFSGEMSVAASPVISHLMAQNAQIVVVSTTPSGPALADRLLREVADAAAVGYSVDSRVLNLGFLPGGTISLLEFVQQPRLAAPATVNGEMAWENSFLSGIDRFQDFSQVIVLTDSAETGRAWVEQIWPQSREVPLFMITSAQAAPMLIPYLNAAGKPNSGQIDGMVSGLMGGAQYGWLAGQPYNPASSFWASYQIGIVLAVVLVLAGGLISGIRRLMNRDEKGEA